MVNPASIKCLCHNISIPDIYDKMKKCNYESINQLQKNKICSTACGLCIPYIESYIKQQSQN
jgi:bacterioferritin-associated ferredoxin